MQLGCHTQTKIALGSSCTLVLVGTYDDKHFERIFDALWLTILRFEKRFSRFLPNSELSHINNRRGTHTPVSNAMQSLLNKSLQLSKITDGLHNPFVLPSLQKAGYHHNSLPAYKGDELTLFENVETVAPESLLLSEKTVFIPENAVLDLGGIGKGYLADKLSKEPTMRNLKGFWFSLGGDISGGGTDEYGQPWKLRIQNAHVKSTTLQFDFVLDESFHIATSGTVEHKGIHKGKYWHHIIDPRTLEPAKSDTILATVLADTTTEADVFASCAIILGAEAGLRFLKNVGATSALLQTTHGIQGFGKLYSEFAKRKDKEHVVL